VVSSVHLSGSLCVGLEHTNLFEGLKHYVVTLVQISGSLCVLLEHTDLFEGWNV